MVECFHKLNYVLWQRDWVCFLNWDMTCLLREKAQIISYSYHRYLGHSRLIPSEWVNTATAQERRSSTASVLKSRCAPSWFKNSFWFVMFSDSKSRHYLLFIFRCTDGRGRTLTLWKAALILCRWEEEGKICSDSSSNVGFETRNNVIAWINTLFSCSRHMIHDFWITYFLFFVLCRGQLGLWLDAELYRSTTTKCATFNNQPLSAQQDFSIHSLEVWTFE